MHTDTSYLNRTPNKTPRSGQTIEFVVWHETASPNPQNPRGTLDYNLRPDVKSSYHYLIAVDGTIYCYVDPRAYIAWHAGKHSEARGYQEWDVNVHSIGVEIDQDNSGAPITGAQRGAAAELMLQLQRDFNIPLIEACHLGHREVAPGYKSDPRGYRIDDLLALAQQRALTASLPPGAVAIDARFQSAWQASGGIWTPNRLTPGYALSPVTDRAGKPAQRFERGMAVLQDDGSVNWLLLSEIDH